ncbi:MAG: hypothetical protein AVO35_02750 [Candidatus Aegiribacteria sp. MLS_C]|nr:MAG: hypothetical protein AVO35_02750 [Candidatus Aegiribacteria sp. MLS_C]
MNDDTSSVVMKGSRGRPALSSVAILMISSAVVLVSVYVLFNYVTGIFRRQEGLEEQLQALLTEESAADLLAADLTRGSISDYSRIPSYEVNGQRTSFQLIGVNSTPPEELEWDISSCGIIQVVPIEDDGGLILLSLKEDTLNMIRASLNGSGNTELLFSIADPSLDTGSASALDYDGQLLVLLPGIDGGIGELIVFGSDSLLWSAPVETGPMVGVPFMTAGLVDGERSVVINSGLREGLIVSLETGRASRVFSPMGTVPLIHGANRLLGDTLQTVHETGGSAVRDVVRGDYNRDGMADIVFAGADIIVLLDGASGRLTRDSLPGFELAAWGTAESKGLLSCRWVCEGRQERWRVFLDGGFMDSPGPEFLPFEWQGRIFYSRNSMIGTISDTVFIASENSGSLTPLFDSGTSVFCNVDGHGPDIINYGMDRLGLILDPLEGNGLQLLLRSSTMDGDRDLLLVSRWGFRVFGSGSGRRVRTERAV